MTARTRPHDDCKPMEVPLLCLRTWTRSTLPPWCHGSCCRPQHHVAPPPPQEEGGNDNLRQWFVRPPDAWHDGERLLAAAAGIVADARAAVEAELGYTCSAGIAHTKILAKLAAGLHKPRAQTVVPAHAVAALLHDLPIPKLRNLGGQFGGEVMQTLGIATVGALAAIPRARLVSHFGEDDAQWLFDLARGVDREVVKPRALPKSAGCGKTFRGVNKLCTMDAVLHWLKQLGACWWAVDGTWVWVDHTLCCDAVPHNITWQLHSA